jgi:hypothetical protein
MSMRMAALYERPAPCQHRSQTSVFARDFRFAKGCGELQNSAMKRLENYNAATATVENYTHSFEEAAAWNADFWKKQSPVTIFDATWQMILDHTLIHTGHADEPRLQRTVERFGKA